MSNIASPIQKYGRLMYKVVVGHSYRLLPIWRRPHDTLVNPRDLPSGELPVITAVPYDRSRPDYDPEKRERLVNIDGWGIITVAKAEQADPVLRTVLEDAFASLDAVPLRGEYIWPGRRVPLGVLLLGHPRERQVHRLALRLARQADALKEPMSLAELLEAARFIVDEVNAGAS